MNYSWFSNYYEILDTFRPIRPLRIYDICVNTFGMWFYSKKITHEDIHSPEGI